MKLSVAQLTAKGRGVSINFRKILEKEGWSSDADGRRVYAAIASLGDRFVTTNYDEWLDLIFPPLNPESDGAIPHPTRDLVRRKMIHQPQHFTAANFQEQDCVVHLHGVVSHPEEMVVTTGDYVRRYANDRHQDDEENTILTFLEYLFSQRTVLFVGYGLEELEVLEYIIMKARASNRRGEARHFIIQGFFSFEKDLCQAMQKYFLNECGVELIPFLRDEQDWRQLILVLEHFVHRLPASEKMVAQELLEMKALING